MFAIISDIHSNIEALSAVLADIDQRGIKKIYCLGDILGYGPNPLECLDLVMERTELCVMGNHDYAGIYEPTNFNLGAEQAAYWCREMLSAEKDKTLAARRWDFLVNRQMRQRMKLKLDGERVTLDFVHASPRRPINEYIFPDDIFSAPSKITSVFENVEHICFIGHTHLPGVFLDEPDFYTPDELGGYYPIESFEKAIVNVGSVGQPRDRDPRASYVYIEDNNVNFIRVEYDIEAVTKKIYDIDMLDNFEADRLIEGR